MRTITPSVTKLLSLLLLTTAALAQRKVAPPPKPADSGPSLPVTMKFIQDRLNEQGAFNYAVFYRDEADGSEWVNQFAEAASNVIANPGTCHISYGWRSVMDQDISQGSAEFDLKNVRSLSVMSSDQGQRIVDADAGHPTWSSRTQPPLFLLRVKEVGNHVNDFNFHDEDTANRVAKALTHAVELCGGGQQNEPF
jgi:hypothetical protein